MFTYRWEATTTERSYEKQGEQRRSSQGRVEVLEKSKKKELRGRHEKGWPQTEKWLKKQLREWELSEWRGKRMEHGRAGSSGLSWCFPKHRPRNAGYFWIQHCDSLSHAMLLNTKRKGLMEAYEYVQTKTCLLIYHRHLKITQVSKNKPWILPLMLIFERQQIFSGIHKNILAVRILFSLQFDCQTWPLWE